MIINIIIIIIVLHGFEMLYVFLSPLLYIEVSLIYCDVLYWTSSLYAFFFHFMVNLIATLST